MNQKYGVNLKQNKQNSGSVIVGLSSEQNPYIYRHENKIITLKSIIIQITRILANQAPLSQQELQTINQLRGLGDALLYLRKASRNSPTKPSLKTGDKNIQNKPNICCKHFQQSNQLKNQIQKKRAIILKLNEGYQQAKQYFSQEVKLKDKNLEQLKKQICQLRAQNEILRQKVDVLQNFRHRRFQDLQKIKDESTKMTKLTNEQSRKSNFSSSNSNSGNIRQDSLQSRKSSYHELKDLIQVLSIKLQSLQQKQQKLNKKIQRKAKNLSSTNSCTSSKAKAKLAQGTQAPQIYIPMSNNSSSSCLLKTKNSFHATKSISQGLIEEVTELRENQSRLLDKICERDEVISELIRLKNNNNSQSKNNFSSQEI